MLAGRADYRKSIYFLQAVLARMAKVAARGPLPSNTLHYDGVSGGVSKVTTAVKRKTPSELRVSFKLPDLFIFIS